MSGFSVGRTGASIFTRTLRHARLGTRTLINGPVVGLVMEDERPSVDRYFMDMTRLVRGRGTCPRRRVGAVIVKDKHVLTTGYNGAPKGFPHPIDQGCIRDELGIPSGTMADVCPCLHAEQNAIIQAATTGVSIKGADLYCTTQPCVQCSRMVANSGIQRVVFNEEYDDPLAIGLLTTAGVRVEVWDDTNGVARAYPDSNTWDQAQDALRRRWRDGEVQAPPTATPIVRHDLVGDHPAAAPASEREHSAEPGDGQGQGPHGGAQNGDAHGGASKDKAITPEMAGVRDISSDPDRDALIRELARRRVEKDRKKEAES